MADQPTEKLDAAAPAAEGQTAAATEAKPEQTEAQAKEETKAEEAPEPAEEPKEAATEGKSEEKPAAEGDSEMPDAPEAGAADGEQATGAVGGKMPLNDTKNRRKSTGGGNRKSLNKKASKAKITHLDAKPGNHYLVKLKGFPEWPAIICDQTMLPTALLNTRPVTAARADGTYAEAYADGGKRAQDRTYPVMFLQTNEFAWVANTALTELTPELAEQKSNGSKVRKDLKLAFELAIEHHDIDFYKDLLEKFEQERIAEQEALAAEAATPKKSKKKAKGGDDGDVDMADADASAKSKTKKRKAEDGADTPQRPDSVKKPKIKLNTNSTPKGTNGASGKDSAKSKPKKKTASKETPVKETPEESLKRRQKEVLYLRYKLQRGLLSKEGQPQEGDMADMSRYIGMLESQPDELEGSIIRETRINKVMKQILKLDNIPKESEFNFKSRSQELLNKWNKTLASDGTSNGVNGAKSPVEEKKTETATGTKEPEAKEAKEESEEKKDEDEAKPEAKAESAEPTKSAEPDTKADEPAKEALAVAA